MKHKICIVISVMNVMNVVNSVMNVEYAPTARVGKYAPIAPAWRVAISVWIAPLIKDTIAPIVMSVILKPDCGVKTVASVLNALRFAVPALNIWEMVLSVQNARQKKAATALSAKVVILILPAGAKNAIGVLTVSNTVSIAVK